MNINWKLRFKNKATLVSLIALVAGFVYGLLGIFGVTPKFSEDTVVHYAMMIVDLLVALGVVVDPTTAGISDSDLALSYDVPRISEPEDEEDVQ